MGLKPVWLDYETFWDSNHTLSKMSPIEYVMHKDTELISVSWQVGSTGPVETVFGEDNVKWAMNSIDWSDKLCIAHNNEGFDSMISAWRCGIKPAMWGCTLAMARPHHAKTAGGSLKALSEEYSLGVKDNSALVNTKGKHLKDFTAEEIEAMRVYNKEDVNLCRELFKVLLPKTPGQEMKLIDQTIRMLVEPKFVVDKQLLVMTLAEERARKRDVLVSLGGALGIAKDYGIHTDNTDLNHTIEQLTGGVTAMAEEVRSRLASAKKFGDFLISCGVEVPLKTSVTTGMEIPALAKTDEAFIALQEHENVLVATAARARLDVKSTLLESRIEAFLTAAESANGRLPIPTKYYGADTTGRRSGWAYNPLNLPRVNPDEPKPSDSLRNSLQAPPGHKVVVADLSGIELRMNMFLWKVPYAMALFNADPENADPYRSLASEVFGVPLEEVTKMQRQAGKAMHLGGGFGLGSAPKFVAVAKSLARIDVTEEEAAEYIAGYRAKHPEVVAGWKKCHAALDLIYRGVEATIDPWGLCTTCSEGVRTPKGMVRYPHLRKQVNEDGGGYEWVYGEGRNKARIYAGKVDENIVQHLSRFVVTDAALEMRRRLKIDPAMEVYDELVYVVPEEKAADTLATLLEIMRTPPSWFPELPVWAVGTVANTYGEAK